MLIRYRTTGKLTGTIELENVAAAQDHLTRHDMTQYLDDDRYPTLKDAIGHIRWNLNGDGHTYYIEALAHRELTDEELKHLSDWCSGQNSDGLGEGFEQQDFAAQDSESEEDCYECGGTGETHDEGLTLECAACYGTGEIESEHYGMISFDWETNKLPFERV